MKVALFFLFIGAVSAYESPLSLEENLLRNSIDELVRQTFEYARWLLKRHEPYPAPLLPEQTLVDDDVNIKFSTSDVQLSQASDFTLDKVSNNLPKLVSSYQVSIPKAHLEGKYEITGTVFKKDVKGSGSFKVDAQKIVQSGNIQFGIVDHSLQIKSLELDYQLGGAQFDVSGLSIEGMTEEEVKEFLNKKLVQNIEQNKEFFVKKAGNHVTEIANKLLKGHSLQDVLDFLKQIVASTPDPPPFPTFAPQL